MEDQKEREKIIMRWLPQLLKSWFGVNATVEVKGGQEIHAEEGKKKEEEKKKRRQTFSGNPSEIVQ